MSTELNIKLFEIANDIFKIHKNDYTTERIISTYWKNSILYSQTEAGLANKDSSISVDVDLPLLSNQVQV